MREIYNFHHYGYSLTLNILDGVGKNFKIIIKINLFAQQIFFIIFQRPENVIHFLMYRNRIPVF